MTTPVRRVAALASAAAVAAAGLAACGGSDSGSAGHAKQLVGLFKLTPGSAKGSQVSGTWFRMIQVGGNAKSGPYMVNANSPADGGQVTLLKPGTSGGLRTGGYQSQPKPAFAADGASLANAITQPTAFFGVKFSISTNAVDPQTKAHVAPPTVYLENGKLKADMSAWAASWNRQDFNQGTPKPVSNAGAKVAGQEKTTKVWDWVSGTWLEAAPAAGVTGKDATGTYDPKTRHFTLEWTSLISGGPFNRFTGQWHLEGTFQPASAAPKKPS
ncbi:MAG: hypothetical protein J2O46_06235 [Nocardioides sp.]|nr:hypothetical protein [Nocardioides sp.]